MLRFSINKYFSKNYHREHHHCVIIIIIINITFIIINVIKTIIIISIIVSVRMNFSELFYEKLDDKKLLLLASPEGPLWLSLDG